MKYFHCYSGPSCIFCGLPKARNWRTNREECVAFRDFAKKGIRPDPDTYRRGGPTAAHPQTLAAT